MADDQAAFGVYPHLNLKRRPENNNPEASKDMPLQFARGMVKTGLGAIPDLAQLGSDIYGGLSGNPAPKVPFTSEYWENKLPLPPTSPQGRLAGGLGEYFPENPVLGAVGHGIKGTAKLAGEGLSSAAMGEGPDWLKSIVPQPSFVVKPKGGNWLNGNVEKALEGLKQSDLIKNVRYFHGPEFEKAREARIENLKQKGDEASLRIAQHLENNREADIPKGALNQWIDKNLTNYVKKEMGTPEDPVRKLAEQGITHMPANEIDFANTFLPEKLAVKRMQAGFNPSDLGASNTAKAWERIADEMLNVGTAGQHTRPLTPTEIRQGYQSTVTDNPWLTKLDPSTPVYYPENMDSMSRDLGFSHIMDVLKQDLQNGRLRPESLKNVSMEQAVRRTHEYDQEMAKKMAEAQIKMTEGMPTVKEYPTGHKWIELKIPDYNALPLEERKQMIAKLTEEAKQKGLDPQDYISNYPQNQLSEALKYEGETMGHCVGGYCPDVISGQSRIFSLRDAKGEPHVTVEVEPNTKHPIGFSLKGNQTFPNDFEYGKVGKRLPEDQHQAVHNRAKQIFDNLEYETPSSLMDSYQQAADEIVGKAPDNIVQIKGKQNRAPNEQYLPFVQDFVKSGNWSDVGDLQNTGLIEQHSLDRQIAKDQFGLDLPRFTTPQESKDYMGLDIDRYHKGANGLEIPESLLKYKIQPETTQPPVDLGTVGGTPNMKKGGKVSITKNPDAMYMEVQDRKFAVGGQVTQSPSDWLKSLANAPSQEFHPIDTLTQNLQGLANLPSKAYEGAKQLVTDPQAYFSNIKAPTPEEMAMAFNPAGLETGMMGMTKAVKPSLLSNEMKVLPNDVSTRVPTAVKATEDPLKSTLLSDYPTMKKDPEALEHNLGLIKTYPNFVSKSRSVNGQMEDFINNTKDNLLFLHDMVPADTRERSKLWYDGAHNIVDRFGNEYGTPEHASAGVLAVLSPQKDWFMNVSLGDRVHDIWKNQGDYKWDKDMTGTANEIFNKPQYAPMLKAIKGKAFNELTDPTEKAMWLRTFDQTYNPREHQIVTPEGDFSGVRLTDKGQPYKTGWGSLNEIGKAIDILDNPSKENISANLGGQHKVRNFYNNIYFPNNPDPHVTIDTHAVAAGLLRPLSGNSREVSHNFGSNALGEVGPKNSAFTGLQGTYPAYAEAYKRAAEERGLLPRQMQSITWEAVRGLFPDTFKNATNNAEINNIWDLYKRKKITIDDARQKILEKAGGINEPEWKQ